VQARADLDCDGTGEFIVERSFAMTDRGYPDEGSFELRMSSAAAGCAGPESLPTEPVEVRLTLPAGASGHLFVDGVKRDAAGVKPLLLPGPHLVEFIGPDTHAGRVVVIDASRENHMELTATCELPEIAGRCPMPSSLLERLQAPQSLATLTAFRPEPGGVQAATAASGSSAEDGPPDWTREPVEEKKAESAPETFEKREQGLLADLPPAVAGLQLSAPCPQPPDSPAARLLYARMKAGWTGRRLADLEVRHQAELGLKEGDRVAGAQALATRTDRGDLEVLVDKAGYATFRHTPLSTANLAELASLLDSTPGLEAYLAVKGHFLCRSLPLTAAGDYGLLGGLLDESLSRGRLDKGRFLELDAEYGASRLAEAEFSARAVCCLMAPDRAERGGAE